MTLDFLKLLNLLFEFITLYRLVTAEEFTGQFVTVAFYRKNETNFYLPLVDLLLVFFKDISMWWLWWW